MKNLLSSLLILALLMISVNSLAETQDECEQRIRTGMTLTTETNILIRLLCEKHLIERAKIDRVKNLCDKKYYTSLKPREE